MTLSEHYYNLPIEEIEQKLETSFEHGLSSEEVNKRQQEYGLNEFKKKKYTSLLMKFLLQFKSFMIIVLLIAAIISGIVGVLHGEGFTDAIIILVIVILNACIGVAQEAKAEKSLDALEKLSSPHSKVIRNGHHEVIESKELVPGDIVILETGDAVPADMRLIETFNLKIQEASLTGESVPEEKITTRLPEDTPLGDRDNMAFGSTSVTYGRGKGVVTETGMESEVGKIAAMIQSVSDVKTPMQKRLDNLGKILGFTALGICLIIFVVGLLYGKDLLDMFMTAVSLAAAAIPEGLPAVSTIVLAVGVQRLVKKSAIVRTLPAVETLGSTQVICSDKTGTLTQNKMTVVKLYSDREITDVSSIIPENIEKYKKLIYISTLVNDAILSEVEGERISIGDPTETAMVDLGLSFGIVKPEIEAEYPRVAEIPFDSERKMMTTVNRSADGKLKIFTKGGVDEVMERCTKMLIHNEIVPLTVKERKEVADANLLMAEKALRVLAVAMKDISSLPQEINSETIENELVLVGLLGEIDPPRESAKMAVEKCVSAGIKPVMITGDHKVTAVAIAESMGIKRIEDEAVTGTELEKMSNEELKERVDKIAVYARVSPEHKVRIVNAFQENGKVVAMTGDGVNDAPALKLADIGVAMGIVGTDVSKEASDVVLADDNFATIVTAVEEGRRIYDNILKAILFMLSTNVGEIVVLFVAILANWANPLLPIHILWINLVTDSLPALALSVDPADPDIMQRKPINSKQGIMTKPFSIRIILQGLMIGTLSLIAFQIGMRQSADSEIAISIAQTMTFAVLAFCQITHVLNVRSTSHSAFRGMFKNRYLIGALVIVIVLMLIVLEIPFLETIFHVTDLNMTQWMWVIGLSILPLPIMEIIKGVERVVKKRSEK